MRRSQSAVEATAEGQLICHIKTQARQTEIVLFTESQKVNDKVKSDSCTASKKASKREKKINPSDACYVFNNSYYELCARIKVLDLISFPFQ